MKFRLHPISIVITILLVLTGWATLLVPYFFAIFLHELAHGFVAKKLGYKLDKIWILPFGACLKYEESSFSPQDELRIAVAGPLMNLFLIILSLAFWWLLPITYTFTYAFVAVNFSILIINLLPCFPLDGGRMLLCLLSKNLKQKTAFKIVCGFNLLFACFFCALFLVSCFVQINFTFITFAILLILGISESKFQANYSPLIFNFSQVKAKKLTLGVKSFAVKSSLPLFKLLPLLSRFKQNQLFVNFENGDVKIFQENEINTILAKNNLENNFEEIIKK